MSLGYYDGMPGVSAARNTHENEYLWGADFSRSMSVQISSAARDASNTPSTYVLRRGLLVGKITASGKYAQYDPAATDGTQYPVGVLDRTVDVYDPVAAAAVDKQAMIRYAGYVRTGDLYLFDEAARVYLGRRFTFDDFREPGIYLGKVTAKTADYTVLSTDNGTLFTTKGAVGAVTFTLPACARGYRFRFFAEADQTMTVAAPSGKLVTFNNLTATSVAFSTSGNKLGAGVEVVANSDGSKYLAFPTGANTMTVA